MRARRPFSALAGWLGILVIEGCGGDGGTAPPPPPPPPPPVASITIDADAKNVGIGATLQLRATARDAQGNARPEAQVTWTSNDEVVASVSSSGLVTGKAGGIAKIRAAVGSITDDATLSVATAFSPGTPIAITADATGMVNLFTPSFGGLHYRLQIKITAGAGLAGAIVGYSEQDGKSVFAIDGPDATWASSLLLGSPDSLLVRVPATAPSTGALAAVAALTVPVAALEARIGLLADLNLTQTANVYRLDKMFAHLGADNSSCVSYLEAAPLLKARPNREIAIAFRAAGASTASMASASVIRREAMTGSDAAVADKLRTTGIEAWGVAPTATVDDRIRLRTDFVDPAKVGAQFRRFWDVAVVTPNDPACPPAVAQLGFVTQPGTVAANATISPAVKVALQDAGGATIPGATNQVTVSLGQNITGATLSGTLTRTPVNGVATFDDLKVDQPGTYTLVVTAAGKTNTSVTFVVTAPPPPAPSGLGVGHTHACGITAAGTTYCWGGGFPGLNGDGGAGNSAFAPSLVVGGHAFAMLSGGQGHNCGMTTAGVVYCWSIAASMLGNGTTGISSTPLPVSGGHTFKWLAAGGLHTCGIRTDGAALCWGTNGNNQIGDGVATTTPRLTPSPVTGGHLFATMTAGLLYSCALTSAGAAYCWGANSFGQLGDGSTTDRPLPTLVAGGLTFARLTAIGATTCGLTAAGVAYCWGLNGDGQIGDNSATNRLAPTPVGGGLVFAALAAGSLHTCGLVTATRRAYCWGSNSSGQLGTGATGADQLTPVPVTGGLAFRTIVAGANFSCGIATTGTTYCWGVNNFGQLGNATNVTSLAPGPIFGTLTF